MLGHVRLLVLPYVLTSALSGYLTVYWLRQLLAWGNTPTAGIRRLVVRGSSGLFAIGLIGAVGLAPFQNYTEVDGANSEVVYECADLVVNQAAKRAENGESPWVVTDGLLDDLLLIVSHQRNVPVGLINVGRNNDDSYRRYLSLRLESPRLQNLARIGMIPLLRELLGGEDTAAERTLVLTSPDIWTLAGLDSVPAQLASVGVKSLADVDLNELTDSHKIFWSSIVPRLRKAGEVTDLMSPVGYAARRLLTLASLMANNLGVCHEKEGSLTAARDAYLASWEILPENVSAILNLNRLLMAGVEVARAPEIESAFVSLRESDRRYDVLALSRVYGYVHDPHAFFGIARTWALTGQPRMAAASLQEALGLAEAEGKEAIKTDLAGLYLGQRRDDESEALYYELLVEDPKNAKALVGLARIAANKGDFEKAQSLQEQAGDAGIDPDIIAFEQALLAVRRSDHRSAREGLESLLRKNENLVPVWELLADVFVELEDWPALERAANRLRATEEGSSLASEIQALLALRKADISAARRYYGEALASQPNKLSLLRRVMQLELTAGNLGGAETHARAILQLDAGDVLANYVIGAERLVDGEPALAEDAFRLSLRGGRLPQALNDLAWLLSQKGELAEAEALAREAVQLRPGMHQAWDTLGEVLLKQGKLEDSEEALQKALSLASDVGAFLHMAQLQAAKGDKEHAREIVQMIADKTGRLSSDAKAEYDRLQRDLGDG